MTLGVDMSDGRLPVSVIVLCYNEERLIEDCMQSLADWAGEIVVVDSGSTDRTVEIVQRYTKQVYIHPFENYARQRNWAQDNLPFHHDWLLHIDADERVTPELLESMRGFLTRDNTTRLNGAMFARRTIFMGRWIKHGGHYPVYHSRLFRKDSGRCEDRRYDQHFVVTPPVVRLEGDLIDILAADLDTWSLKHVRWAAQEAQELLSRRDRHQQQVVARLGGNPIEQRRWLRNVVFGRSPLFARAFAYFIYRYFLRRGFLDGIEGLIFHFLHGCWFHFYVDAKIWEFRRKQAMVKDDNLLDKADRRRA